MSKPYWTFKEDLDGCFHIESADGIDFADLPPDTGPTKWPVNRRIGFVIMESVSLRVFQLWKPEGPLYPSMVIKHTDVCGACDREIKE